MKKHFILIVLFLAVTVVVSAQVLNLSNRDSVLGVSTVFSPGLSVGAGPTLQLQTFGTNLVSAYTVTDNGGEAYRVTDNGGEDYNVQ